MKILVDKLSTMSLQMRRVILGFVLMGILGSGLGLGLFGYVQLRDNIVLPENEADKILGDMIVLGNTLGHHHKGILALSRAKTKADYEAAVSTLPTLKLAIEGSLNISAAVSELESPGRRKAQHQLQALGADIRAYFNVSQEAINAFDESHTDLLRPRARRSSQSIGTRASSNEISSAYAAVNARLWEASGEWQVAVKQAKEHRQRLLLVGALLALVIVMLGAWQVLIRRMIHSFGFHQSLENTRPLHADQGEEPIAERQRDMMERQVLQFLASVRAGNRNTNGHGATEKPAKSFPKAL